MWPPCLLDLSPTQGGHIGPPLQTEFPTGG
jgi:hypothetical protein